MANPPRTRKRIHAIRRASDGSAFQKCNLCGVSVAVALADMHECESRKNVKRFKGGFRKQKIVGVKQRFQDQPRSPFRLFMEGFAKTYKHLDQIQIDRSGFEMWKNMSKKERLPYAIQAEKVNSAYEKALLQEVEDMSWVEDEADSAVVGKHDKNYIDYDCYEDDSDGYESFWYESSETNDWYSNPVLPLKYKSRARASKW